MPRGKKARTEESESKPHSKNKSKPHPDAPPVELKVYSQNEITSFLSENAGNFHAIQDLTTQILNSSLSKSLISSIVSSIFEIVEQNPSRLEWGKACIQSISAQALDPKDRIKQVYFFPNPESEKALINRLDRAERSLLVCVFTITNNDLADALRRARARGVLVKIISDDEMLRMNGSDVQALHNEGFEVRVDLDMRAHMHHKFAVVDDYILITGSFNWTKQAVNKNQENLVIIDDPSLAREFSEHFEKMWKNFEKSVDRYLGGEVISEEKKELKVVVHGDFGRNEMDIDEKKSSDTDNLSLEVNTAHSKVENLADEIIFNDDKMGELTDIKYEFKKNYFDN